MIGVLGDTPLSRARARVQIAHGELSAIMLRWGNLQVDWREAVRAGLDSEERRLVQERHRCWLEMMDAKRALEAAVREHERLLPSGSEIPGVGNEAEREWRFDETWAAGMMR